MAHSLCIGVLVEKRYFCQAQPAGVCTVLRTRNHEPILLDPGIVAREWGHNTCHHGLDLIIARGRSWDLLYLLAWTEALGRLTINRRSAIVGVHNKAEMVITLAANGIPTPRTFVGQMAELLESIPSNSYPIILKPIFGDNGKGLRIIHGPTELSRMQWPEPLALAQTYLPNDGYDLKLYVVGQEVWAVRKLSPLFSDRAAAFEETIHGAELIPVQKRWEELALQCGRLFGLELYGVDCIQTPDGLQVIEVNDFPNYTGIPNINERLADYILARAHQEGLLS